VRADSGAVGRRHGAGGYGSLSASFAGSVAHQERARKTLARGVATAFRASQLPVPICFERGAGSRIVDVDGNEYVDYALAFGPLLLGHSPHVVLDAVRRQLETGLGYGASHRLEADLSEAVCRTVPCAELAAFSNTGSEAVHSAIRIARAATGRNRVIKFLGHYDGWYDSIHVGVPPQSRPGPGTSGQDPGAAAAVTVCPWNDVAALESALTDDVAAVIMEPLNVNGGCIAPAPGYLERARALTRANGTVLIFDEVITGYRLALGGAQERFGVVPDLTILGKALGAGFPISAVCGSTEVMDVVADGRVAHVGTFNANPVCAAAALAATTWLEEHQAEVYPRLEANARSLAAMLVEESAAVGLSLQVNVDVGTMCAFVADLPVPTYVETLAADAGAYRLFAQSLLENGMHVIPRGLLYVSTEHGATELDLARASVAAAAASYVAKAEAR
jgi:glutamate-1-semialdehyde 2,1-aminomutase